MKSERRDIRKVLIFVVPIAIVVSLTIVTASVATYYVNSDESVQAAVNTTSSGDTVMLASSTYRENVNVNEQLTLQGVETGSGKPMKDTAGSRSLNTSSRAQEVQAVDASAAFCVYYSAGAGSNNDTITSGLHLVQYDYGLSINNFDDPSDTVLGNLEYTLQADNIREVRNEEYADWNESYVKWIFPVDYVLFEGDWLHTSAKTSFFETRYVPMSIGRRTNESIFEADGYQLAEFNLTFEDMNFDYTGGLVKTAHREEEHSLVNASFLPDTFSTDAPLWLPIPKKDEHEIYFDLDKSQLQANKTYNFSVVVRVDLKSDKPYPILYKPYYSIWVGFNSSGATGPTGKNVTMPTEMLPEHIHYASASTNVSNNWYLARGNQLGVTLEKVSEPLGPKSEIHVHKEEWVSTSDSHIDHNKIYNFTTDWDANVWKVEDLDNVTYTLTTSENFIYISNWELYQNGTENSFILPPTVEGQNYTWVLPLEDRIGSVINFMQDSPQTVQDNPWVDMDVNTINEGDYTRVNVTFTPVVPLNWIDLYVRGDQIIDVSAYPPEFEIKILTSDYVKFSSGDIIQDHVYNFSVLVDNPSEVFLWLEASFGWVEEPPSETITLPVAELGSVTLKADVPVIWEHKPTLPQNVQSIEIEFEEKKGFDTGEGTYPSIMGTHNGTITPSDNITVSKLYTYPCAGTGGHTEYARIWNKTWGGVEAYWNGYEGDWHNISFNKTFTLVANETYNYTIRTGSYPQIHHSDNLSTTTGFITCTEFIDANGKRYNDWIPAIRLE